MNTYGDISPLVGVKASARFLRVVQAKIITQRFGQPDDQPKNVGQKRKWRRYENLPPTLAPLTEGITPDPQAILYTDYEVMVQQYGGWVPLTDVIADTHTDPILNIMTDRLGDQGAQTVELVTIDVLKAGTNVDFSVTATQRSEVVAAITRGDLMRVVRTLDAANAMRVTQIIGAGAKIATEPVEAAYVAMCHTNLKPDIRNLTGFEPVASYSSHDKALPNEFGKCMDVRFVLSTNFRPFVAEGGSTANMLANGQIPSGATNCDVYPVIIVGQEAYGVVRLQGRKAAQILVHNPKPDSSDPLAQRGSVGWKTWYASVILNHTFIVRLEVACTARPT